MLSEAFLTEGDMPFSHLLLIVADFSGLPLLPLEI